LYPLNPPKKRRCSRLNFSIASSGAMSCCKPAVLRLGTWRESLFAFFKGEKTDCHQETNEKLEIYHEK